MREDAAVPATAIGTDEPIGTNAHPPSHPRVPFRLPRWYSDHSAVTYDTEFFSAIVYLKIDRLAGHYRRLAARSFLIEDPGWGMVSLGREI